MWQRREIDKTERGKSNALAVSSRRMTAIQ